MPAGAPLLTPAAVRGVFACFTSGCVGALAGHGDLVASQIAITGAAIGGAALLLAIFTEMLRGGHGPILAQLIREMTAEIGELIKEMATTRSQIRAHITELEVQIAHLKSSANAAHRASRASIADGTGKHDAL